MQTTGLRRAVAIIAARTKSSEEWFFAALLLITVICKFVPFAPLMPRGSLDPSWRFGLNQAVAQGLAFGSDIVFTLGPYASIVTRDFHPGTDSLMVWGSLYFSLSFWLAALLNFRGSNFYLKAAFILTLASIINSPDSLLILYPLLVGTHLFNVTTSMPDGDNVTCRWHVGLVALFAPFGLLPLIKGSSIFSCAAIAALCVLLLGLRKSWASVATMCLTPLVSLMLFWVAAGQSLSALPSYLISMLPITSGYTEAMMISGPARELWFYITGTVIIVWAIVRGIDAKGSKKAVLPLMFLAAFFVAFKSGFVRHDVHAMIAGGFILLAALLMNAFITGPRAHISLIVALATWLVIDANYLKTSSESVLRSVLSTYSKS
ncbi:MAG TPA: hypothetical protein VIV27_09905, partial [Halioglobus sp.]